MGLDVCVTELAGGGRLWARGIAGVALVIQARLIFSRWLQSLRLAWLAGHFFSDFIFHFILFGLGRESRTER